MENSLKLTKKKVDKIIKDNEYLRDEQGRIVVKMTIQDDKHVLSEFSQTETPVIDSKVAEFIENSTLSIPVKEHLNLRITSDCITDNEKEVYSKGIKEYYKQKYFSIQAAIKQNYLIATILTIVSLILLTASIFLRDNLTFDIWAEAINIIGCFFLWETVGIFSFKTQELRFKRNKYLTYISMKIEYIDIKK